MANNEKETIPSAPTDFISRERVMIILKRRGFYHGSRDYTFRKQVKIVCEEVQKQYETEFGNKLSEKFLQKAVLQTMLALG